MGILGSWPDRWHAIVTLHRRDWRALFLGLGLYVSLFIALMASSVILRNNLAYAEENGVIVMIRPLYVPFVVTTVVSSLYLALVSVTTIARERDQGTLEVLFYGPVDGPSYFLSKYGTVMLAGLCVVTIGFLWSLAYAQLTNLVFSPDLLLVLILSLGVTSAVIAFAMLVSTVGRSMRSSLVLFLAVVTVFLVIQGGHEALSGLPLSVPANRINPVLYLRDALALLNRLAQWLSPYSHLNTGIEALTVGNIGLYLAMLAVSVVYTAAFLALGMVLLARKGVRA